MTMITDADVKKLIKEFTKIFTTKEDLRVQKEDILDEMDNKFTSFREEVDQKFKNLVEQIAGDFAKAVGPFMDASDDHDIRIKHLEKHTSHPPVAD